MIPAGTGLKKYKKLKLISEIEASEAVAEEEVKTEVKAEEPAGE